MRICLMIEVQEGVEWEQWLALAQGAQAAGLDGFFSSDHYRSINRGEPAGALDAWTTLAAIAASTERIRLGTLVSPVTFRHVSVLAKSVVTVDHISGGRAELGIGAGWYESEHAAYGFPFLDGRGRFDEFERQLGEIVRQWTEAEDIWPKPIQKPRPPIILGGRAGPRAVRAAVRFADEYNTFGPTIEEARERCRAVQAGAVQAGREPLTFSIALGTVIGRDEAETQDRLKAWRETTGSAAPHVSGTVEQLTETLAQYAAVGVDRVMIQHLVHEDVEMVPLIGELARAVAEL